MALSLSSLALALATTGCGGGATVGITSHTVNIVFGTGQQLPGESATLQLSDVRCPADDRCPRGVGFAVVLSVRLPEGGETLLTLPQGSDVWHAGRRYRLGEVAPRADGWAATLEVSAESP